MDPMGYDIPSIPRVSFQVTQSPPFESRHFTSEFVLASCFLNGQNGVKNAEATTRG